MRNEPILNILTVPGRCPHLPDYAAHVDIRRAHFFVSKKLYENWKRTHFDCLEYTAHPI